MGVALVPEGFAWNETQEISGEPQEGYTQQQETQTAERGMKGLGLADHIGSGAESFTLAGVTDPSLSDSSLLSESSSAFPVWTLGAPDPAVTGHARWVPFPDDPRLTVEAGLTCGLFPKGFTCK